MFCPFLENREEEKMINKLVAKIKETRRRSWWDWTRC